MGRTSSEELERAYELQKSRDRYDRGFKDGQAKGFREGCDQTSETRETLLKKVVEISERKLDRLAEIEMKIREVDRRLFEAINRKWGMM